MGSSASIKRSADGDAAARRMLARVRAALDSSDNGLDEAQDELFGYLASQMAQYQSIQQSPVVPITEHVGNYWRNFLLVIIQSGSYRPSALRRLLLALDPNRPISQRMLTLN